MIEESFSREPMSDEELSFLALSKDDLKKMSQSFSFDVDTLRKRLEGGEDWVKLIQAHLYFDHVLTAMLTEALANPDAISTSRMSFSQKVQLIHAMGLLPQELISPIDRMNSLRNKIAHRLDFIISEDDVRDFCNCVPRSLREAVATLETRADRGPLTLDELLTVLLLQVEIDRQMHAFERLNLRQAKLSLRAALLKVAPTLRSIQNAQTAPGA